MSNEEKKSDKKRSGWGDLLSSLGLAPAKEEKVEETKPEEPQIVEEQAVTTEIEAPKTETGPVEENNPFLAVAKEAPTEIDWTAESKKSWDLSNVFGETVSETPKPVTEDKSDAPKERFPKIDIFATPPAVSEEPRVEKKPQTGKQKPKSSDPWSKIASQLGVLSGDIDQETVEEEPEVVSKPSRERGKRSKNRNRESEPKETEPVLVSELDPFFVEEAKEERKEKKPPRSRSRRNRGFGSGLLDDEELAEIEPEILEIEEEPVIAKNPSKKRIPEPEQEDESDRKEKRSRKRRRSSRKDVSQAFSDELEDDNFEFNISPPKAKDFSLDLEEDDDDEEEFTPPPQERKRRGRGVRVEPVEVYEDEEDAEEEFKPARASRREKERTREKDKKSSHRSRTAMNPVVSEDYDDDDLEMVEASRLQKTVPDWNDAIEAIVEANIARHAVKKSRSHGRRR